MYKINDIINVTITSILSYGVFVKADNDYTGLIHISEISNSFIKHPNEVLKVGDILDFYVKDIDKEKGRVGLTLKK